MQSGVLDAALTWTQGVLQHARTADPGAPTPCRAWTLVGVMRVMPPSETSTRVTLSRLNVS